MVTMINECIRVSNLCKDYGSFQLKNVSFNLPQGCIMGLIGENGAGKSTTLKLLLNLLKKDGGEIALFGLDPAKQEHKIKEQIGVVFDENFFHDVLRAKDIPSIMRPIYANWDDRLYDSLCARFQLPVEKRIKEYSRGMKMKLAIAAAMAHHPRLLLLDEATSALDTESEKYIQASLDKLREGRTSFVVAHRLSTIVDADMIVVMDQGAVVEAGTHFELLENDGPYARLYKIQFSHQKAGKPETQEV